MRKKYTEKWNATADLIPLPKSAGSYQDMKKIKLKHLKNSKFWIETKTKIVPHPKKLTLEQKRIFLDL